MASLFLNSGIKTLGETKLIYGDEKTCRECKKVRNIVN